MRRAVVATLLEVGMPTDPLSSIMLVLTFTLMIGLIVMVGAQ